MTFAYFGFQQLIDNLDRDLQYAIRVEGKMELESVSNYDEVKNAILEKVLIDLFISIKLMNELDSKYSF